MTVLEWDRDCLGECFALGHWGSAFAFLLCPWVAPGKGLRPSHSSPVISIIFQETDFLLLEARAIKI